MEKFIKKSNLGIVFGTIVFVLIFLFSFYQTLTNKSLTRKSEKTLNNYASKMNEVITNIDSSNIQAKKDEIKKILDEYWADSDSDDFSANVSYVTKDQILNSFDSDPETFKKIIAATTEIECSMGEKSKGKYFDVSCNVTNNFTFDNNVPNPDYIKFLPTYIGALSLELSVPESMQARFKYIDGKWKICGLQTGYYD